LSDWLDFCPKLPFVAGMGSTLHCSQMCEQTRETTREQAELRVRRDMIGRNLGSEGGVMYFFFVDCWIAVILSVTRMRMSHITARVAVMYFSRA